MWRMSDRDFRILKYLSYGPSTVYTIGKTFFPNSRNGKEKQKKLESSSGRWETISWYVYTRLNTLSSYGLLKTTKEKSYSTPIVTLTEEGACEVSRRFGIDLDEIRYSYPRSIELTHDLMAAAAIRKIVEESEEKNLYKIEYLHTEVYMRRLMGRAANRKGVFLPDFRVRIVPYKGPALTLDVEIDAMSTGMTRLAQKLAFFRNHTLVILMNSQRVGHIFDYLQRVTAKKSVALPKLSFVLFQNFVANGCRFSKVVQYPSGDTGVLPIVVN